MRTEPVEYDHLIFTEDAELISALLCKGFKHQLFIVDPPSFNVGVGFTYSMELVNTLNSYIKGDLKLNIAEFQEQRLMLEAESAMAEALRTHEEKAHPCCNQKARNETEK